MADVLTDEERAFWDEIGFSLPKDGEDMKTYVFGMRAAYHFDGYQPPPSEAAIRAEVERRRGANATAP